MRSIAFDDRQASLCGYTEYGSPDLPSTIGGKTCPTHYANVCLIND